MKLSDFLIRGRHLFGFLIPGLMWIASFFYLTDRDLITFVEGGNSWIRIGVLLGISYILGFILQTLIFPVIADSLKKLFVEKSKKYDKMDAQLVEILKAKLPANQTELLIEKNRLPNFCKYYILEFADELKRKVMEKENDINLMVATMIPAPLLVFSIIKSNLSGGYIWLTVGVIIVFWVGLVFRLRHYLEGEKEEWREIFLLLQMFKDEKKIEAKKEDE
jgi:hypothetical protein